MSELDNSQEGFLTLFKRVISFLFGFCLTIVVWNSSLSIAGVEAAWDAPGYYLPSLAVMGLLSGLIFPKKYGMAFLGILSGQSTYISFCLPDEPYWIYTLHYDVIFASIALVCAVISSSIRSAFTVWFNKRQTERIDNN